MIKRNHVVWLRIAVVIAALAASIHCARGSNENQVVARIGDREITLAEIDQRWSEIDPASRMQARQQYYDGRKRVLDQMIAEQVIEMEARAKGVTPERLLDDELTRRIRPVTEQEIVEAYRDAADQAQGMTLETARPRIGQYLREQRDAAALRAFAGELRTASNVRVSLDPPRLQVNTSPSDPRLGPAAAPVTIVEFSDFQCPYCKQAAPTLKKIQAAFGDRVRVVYKDSPLPNHPNAFDAAEAAQCAHDQGKFWDYHDVLFDHQDALQRPRLTEYAMRAGLDRAKFTSCLEAGKFKGYVEEDLVAAQTYGVASTPTLFVNGRILMGAVPYEELEQVVREELARPQSASKPQ